MDLYAEGMDENASPLRQTYLDLERLYYVYEEPTYRDILELCLRPFAGQIFQSNGALHIRHAVSLYRSSRPVSFYRVGAEYPVGRIIRCLNLLLIRSGRKIYAIAAATKRTREVYAHERPSRQAAGNKTYKYPSAASSRPRAAIWFISWERSISKPRCWGGVNIFHILECNRKSALIPANAF